MLRQIKDVEEIQEAAFHILQLFDEFCREYRITYYPASGTLIGAVRHQGFIPWDDDIDLWLKREEYRKVLKHFPEWGKKHGLYLNSAQTTPHYDRLFAKVCIEGTKVRTLDRLPRYREGCFIDLFVLDGCPNGRFRRELRITELQVLRNLLTLSNYAADRLPGASVKQKVFGFAARFFRWLDTVKLIKLYEKIASRSRTEDSEYLLLPMRQSMGRAALFPTKWFGKGRSCSFGSLTVTLPSDYDSILKKIYGDYMQLPPEDQRVPGHLAKFYKEEKDHTV